MTIRNWLRFFFTTLFIGGATTGIFGFIVRWDEFQSYFTSFNIISILSTLIWFVLVGFLFSVISQVIFFAYLMVHQLAIGVLRSLSLWNGVQFVLIAIALFDLIYFRFERFAQPGESILSYIALAAFILIIGIITAYFKVKQTKKSMFIPTLFFMVVGTILAWVTSLRVDERSWVYIMLFALIICNAYQILALPSYNERSAQERADRIKRSGGEQRKKPFRSGQKQELTTKK